MTPDATQTVHVVSSGEEVARYIGQALGAIGGCDVIRYLPNEVASSDALLFTGSPALLHGLSTLNYPGVIEAIRDRNTRKGKLGKVVMVDDVAELRFNAVNLVSDLKRLKVLP